MILRTSYIVMLLGMLGLSLSGCEEDRHSGAAGRLNLNISASGAVTDVTTRSGEEGVPDIKDFSIAMLQGDKVQSSWEKLSDYDDDTTFPIGTYKLRAFYGDMEKEGFASPYYEGSSEVVISGGATTEVETTCQLANTKLTVEYTDDFKNYFKTYSAAVKSELGSEVTFVSAETRAAYVKPGRVSVKVTFTKATGGVGSSTVDVATIEAALPQHHYHLLMDVDAGKAMLSVVFDRVTEEKPITLDISDKALNIKAPYFTLTGFEKTSNDNNQWDGNLTEANKLSALLTSLGGFKKCILRATSPNLQGWKEEGYDLANLAAEDLIYLTQSGIKLTGFGENKDQMAIIDFTGVVPHLNISDANSEHLFYLQATSTYGKESEEYVLNITTPKNFMLLPTAPVTMKSATVTIPVKLKSGNSQNIKLYYKYYGVMTLINATTITPADKEGYYNIKAIGIDMGFAAKDFQAEYMGVKSAIVTVGVIIPEYTFSLNPENIWSYSADMTIVPENAGDLLNLMSAIEPYISLDGTNWNKWENISLDANTGKVVLEGLTAGAKYYFRTTCDDGETFTSPVMYTMESATPIPNADFSHWGGGATYPNIQNGGKSTYLGGTIGTTNKFRDPVYVSILYKDLLNWTSTNSLTVPSDANPQNTWYMVPSVLQHSEIGHSSCVFLRNVAWNIAGEPVKNNTDSYKDWFTTKGNAVQPPSTFNRSSGKIYFGAVDGAGKDTGISCMSRPAKISFNYKYAPVTAGDNSGGVVRFVLENESGQTIAQFEETLSATDWAPFEKSFDYQISLKPARLRLLFTSSTHWSFDQNEENARIKTTHETNNSDDALKISVGSGLYIENIVLTYK